MSRPVAGMICMRPVAPLGDTAPALKRDSTAATALTSEGSMPWRRAARSKSGLCSQKLLNMVTHDDFWTCPDRQRSIEAACCAEAVPAVTRAEMRAAMTVRRVIGHGL